MIKLADKHSVARLEAACSKALSYTPSPSYKSIKTILSTGQDKAIDEPTPAAMHTAETYGFVRGAGYYGRKNDDE